MFLKKSRNKKSSPYRKKRFTIHLKTLLYMKKCSSCIGNLLSVHLKKITVYYKMFSVYSKNIHRILKNFNVYFKIHL